MLPVSQEMGQRDPAYGAAVAGTPSWSPADLLSFAIGAGWCSVATASLSAVVIDMLASGVAISRMMEGMGRARHDIASSIVMISHRLSKDDRAIVAAGTAPTVNTPRRRGDTAPPRSLALRLPG